MWRELVESASDGTDAAPEFAAPASESEIAEVEHQMAVQLPFELRALLTESNGISASYGSLVWGTSELVSQNREFRTSGDYPELYMPFDHILFFASDAGGDCFGFRILQGVPDAHNVYRWDHETDGRRWVASGLRQFVERWCKDALDD